MLPADTIRAVQTALRARGYDPGPADGILGGRTTAAVSAFQYAAGLVRPRGPLRYPGTIGPTTLNALNIQAPPPVVAPPWYAEAQRVMGLHETAHNSRLRQWLRLDGSTLGDPARLPWCGDLVQTAIRLALPSESVPVNPYAARSWASWGQKCGPTLGAVVSFWRGSRAGWQGHVGFVAGMNASGTLVYTLGGNQSNRVSIAPLAANRVLGFRWPVTAGTPPATPPPIRTGGVVSTNEA